MGRPKGSYKKTKAQNDAPAKEEIPAGNSSRAVLIDRIGVLESMPDESTMSVSLIMPGLDKQQFEKAVLEIRRILKPGGVVCFGRVPVDRPSFPPISTNREFVGGSF